MGAIGIGVRLLGTAGLPDAWWSVPLLGAFPWFVAWSLLTVVAVLLRLLVRRDRPVVTGAAVLVAAAALLLVVPRLQPVGQPEAAGEVVTIGVVNVRIGAADTAVVADLGVELDLDLLAVVESTPASSRALVDGPLGTLLPTHENATTEVGGIVLARGALEPLAGLPHAGGTPDVLWRTASGTAVDVTTLHASAPVGATATDRWRDGLARTPQPGQRPALVLGDFNATVDHATFRGLLDAGWRDAATEVGAGLAPTYDGLADGSPGLPMTIDHVLVGPGIAVRSVSTHDVPGTDHRLVVATLQLP